MYESCCELAGKGMCFLLRYSWRRERSVMKMLKFVKGKSGVQRGKEGEGEVWDRGKGRIGRADQEG